MNTHVRVSRRTFLRTTIVAAGALAAPGRIHAAAPSERIAIGMIGVGRQGTKVNLQQFLDSPNAQVVAVCDVDAWRLQNAKQLVEASYAAQSGQSYAGCAAFHDFRELLARDDIDAVMISTPDHWHVPAAVAAIKAGKHVACEKPLTTSLAHGRQLCSAAAASGLVTRTDSEFRSLPAMQQAVQAVHNGRIGELKRMVTHLATCS